MFTLKCIREHYIVFIDSLQLWGAARVSSYRMRIATRQASSPVSETALDRMRSARVAASSAGAAAAAVS